MARIDNKSPDLIGAKVIVQGQKDTWLGTLIRWHTVHKQSLPVVQSLSSEEEFICFGVLLPYNSHVFELLKSMGADKAYEWAANMSILTQVSKRKEFGR